MATPSVISEDVLAPISAANPSGTDLSGTAEWVSIRNARPNTWDSGNRGDWERADSKTASWLLLKNLTSEALAGRSKDLRLALWLTEASIKLHHFAGVRDGVRTIRELIDRFWDSGLYPEIEDGDIEARSGPLEWLNDKLADAIREVPITKRLEPGANYSVNYFRESRRSNGLITAQEFDAAVLAGAREEYERLRDDFEAAQSELGEFERVATEKLGPDHLSLAAAKEAFEECRRVLANILRQKGSPSSSETAAANSDVQHHTNGTSPLGSLERFGAPGDLGVSWNEAGQLALKGDVDRALSQMTRLANVEPNGRIRFQRKLLLADICLNSKRQRLGRAILEELSELIDRHQLEFWETSELVGAVWSRLYKCYSNEGAGMADPERAAKLYDRLCRLNPWQALGCGDGH